MEERKKNKHKDSPEQRSRRGGGLHLWRHSGNIQKQQGKHHTTPKQTNKQKIKSVVSLVTGVVDAQRLLHATHHKLTRGKKSSRGISFPDNQLKERNVFIRKVNAN